MKRILILAVCVVLVAATLACRRPPERPSRGRVRIAAASDLNAALGELVARFTASHPVDVMVSYGSSGTFYSQLLNEAPFDLFFSADVEYPRLLATRGKVLPGSEFHYGVGRLVLWVPNASAIDPRRDGLRALTAATVTHVAIANPDHAPYGRAAVAALRTVGTYDAVKSKLVFGESVAQALQFVQSGAADAGLVALSLALAPAARDAGKYVELPLADYPRIDQGGVILRWAEDVESARAFRAFVIGADGVAILKQFGFSRPTD